MPYPHTASQHRENVGVEFPDSHEPYFGSGSFSRPEAGLTNLERWPIFSRRSLACSGSTEFTGQFLEPVFLRNHQPFIFLSIFLQRFMFLFVSYYIGERCILNEILNFFNMENLFRIIIFFFYFLVIILYIHSHLNHYMKHNNTYTIECC